LLKFQLKPDKKITVSRIFYQCVPILIRYRSKVRRERSTIGSTPGVCTLDFVALGGIYFILLYYPRTRRYISVFTIDVGTARGIRERLRIEKKAARRRQYIIPIGHIFVYTIVYNKLELLASITTC